MVGSSSLMVIRKAAKCPKLEFARVVPKKKRIIYPKHNCATDAKLEPCRCKVSKKLVPPAGRF